MSRTILLADDSLTIQKVVELTFADTEYEVVAVSSGDELMERIPELRPDLVICDVIMPGRDGYDVCQEIKSSSEHLHLPVILLTGTFEPFDRDRAIAVGCSEIITKPFEAKKLVDAVERLAATPSAPPPSSVDTQSIEPDDLTPPDSEEQLDDTEVSQEFGPGEAMTDEPAAAEVIQEPEMEEAPADEPIAAEPIVDEPAEPEIAASEPEFELETPDLPEVEAPAEFGELEAAAPDPAKTLAAEDFAALMEAEKAEAADASPEGEVAEEPFIDEEPFPTEEVVGGADEPAELETDQSLTTPIDVAAVMAEHEPEVEIAAADEISAPDNPKDDADTQDFGDTPPVEAAPEENVGGGLSDEDIDRIARRVLELAGDRIEHIAWDVIPDMAEVVVRERVRELESEADHE
jgi:CheY-like chemotaxis protein